ncbi:MAG: DUF58 domain-containing protein [Candidatus Bathyarchaeia archaeon]
MFKVKVKPAGKVLTLSTVALALLSTLFLDLLILAASLIMAFATLFSFSFGLWRVGRLSRKASVNPSAVELRLVAGASENFRVVIECPWRLSVYVRHPLKFCTVKPQPCLTNEAFTLEFSPKLAGVYDGDWLEVEIESPIKAFAFAVQLPFKTGLTVLPRVVPLAVRALELAAGLGVTAYEVPLQALGRGTEYAETREYMPGDDLRRLDWKATARLRKLMVKQFHMEAEGAVNLIYDLKAAGPVTRDIVAAEFLRMAIALSEQNVPYTLTIVNEAGGLETLRFRGARTALLTAVKYALKAVEVDLGFLYELMEPQAAREAAMFLKAMGLEQPTKELPLDGNFLAVTCLLGDLTWLMDIYEGVRSKNRRLTVHVPFKVWLDSPTLEEAYKDYEEQARLLAALKKKGIDVKTI